MFFRKLYQHNKFLFVAVITFLLAYFYINYKWGMIATPVQQYGMFSGRHMLHDPIPVFFIQANGNVINNADLSPIERDLLQSFPEYYMRQQKGNKETFESVKKYLFLGNPSFEKRHRDKFFNELNETTFTNWYSDKVGEIIHERVSSLVLHKQIYSWKNNQLLPIDTPAKMNFIVAR